MKQVQQALAGIDLPVFVGIWRATSKNQSPPERYVVYSTTMTEDAHQDDRVVSYKTFVYMNLWSDTDPTEMADRIRQAMYAADFWMVEESDRGYNMPAYDTATKQYTIQRGRRLGSARPCTRRGSPWWRNPIRGITSPPTIRPPVSIPCNGPGV